MSALNIFEFAPIGSIVAWSDGTPRPPERHRKKLLAWQKYNSCGRVIRKQGQTCVGSVTLAASFTLHETDIAGRDVIAIRVHQTFAVDSFLHFTVIERPAAGSVRIFARPGDNAELVHLAPHRAAAEEWLSRHGYPGAVLEEVSADEVAADVVEGRAAA